MVVLILPQGLMTSCRSNSRGVLCPGTPNCDNFGTVWMWGRFAVMAGEKNQDEVSMERFVEWSKTWCPNEKWKVLRTERIIINGEECYYDLTRNKGTIWLHLFLLSLVGYLGGPWACSDMIQNDSWSDDWVGFDRSLMSLDSMRSSPTDFHREE